MAKVTVLGGGGWAIALAKVLDENGNDVTLWSFLQREVDALKNHRENKIGLPGIKIPESIEITNNMAEAVKDSEMIVMAVASSFVNGVPSNSFVADPDVKVTRRLLIVKFPGTVVTANCAVTSFPAASFTIAVPVTGTV